MTPTGDKKWVIGVDLGGTNIVVGVLPIDGGNGNVLALKSEPTDAERRAMFRLLTGRKVHDTSSSNEAPGRPLSAEGATQTSNVPGSTVGRKFWPMNVRSLRLSRKLTVSLSPGASATLSKATSRFGVSA